MDDQTRTCLDDVNVYVHGDVGVHECDDCDASDDAVCLNVPRNHHRILGIYMSNPQWTKPTVAHWLIVLVFVLVDHHRPCPSSCRVIVDFAEMCPFDLIDETTHSNCCCRLAGLLDTFSRWNSNMVHSYCSTCSLVFGLCLTSEHAIH